VISESPNLRLIVKIPNASTEFSLRQLLDTTSGQGNHGDDIMLHNSGCGVEFTS